MRTATFTLEALETATPEQMMAVNRLLIPETVRNVDVQRGGFDLPDGYLAVAVEYVSGSCLYGGIDPDGSVST